MTGATPIKIVKRALWRPGWHQLDQSLGAGQFGRFAFFAAAASSPGSESVSSSTQGSKPGARPGPGEANPGLEFGGEPVDLQFFNRTISERHEPIFRFARILEIIHPVLGPLERVDTTGLDYVFKPVGNPEIFVNAEEEPGVAYDFEQCVEDWSLLVTVDDVSDPIADAVV